MNQDGPRFEDGSWQVGRLRFTSEKDAQSYADACAGRRQRGVLPLAICVAAAILLAVALLMPPGAPTP